MKFISTVTPFLNNINNKIETLSRDQLKNTSFIGSTGKAFGRFRTFFSTANSRRAAIDNLKNSLIHQYGENIANSVARDTLDPIRRAGKPLTAYTARLAIGSAYAQHINNKRAHTLLLQDIKTNTPNNTLNKALNEFMSENYKSITLTPELRKELNDKIADGLAISSPNDGLVNFKLSDNLKKFIAELPSINIHLKNDEANTLVKNYAETLSPKESSKFYALLNTFSSVDDQDKTLAYTALIKEHKENLNLTDNYTDIMDNLWKKNVPNTPLPKMFELNIYGETKNFLSELNKALTSK